MPDAIVNLAAGDSPAGLILRQKRDREELEAALERTDQALRAVLAGRPVRDADEILVANAWLLFGAEA